MRVCVCMLVSAATHRVVSASTCVRMCVCEDHAALSNSPALSVLSQLEHPLELPAPLTIPPPAEMTGNSPCGEKKREREKEKV